MEYIKKHLSYISAFFIIAVIYLTSCEDFLDVKQGDQILPEDHYKSVKEVDNVIIGSLAHMQNFMPNNIITLALLGDLADITDNSDGDLIDINLHRTLKDNIYIDASGYYKVIISLNECLKYLPSLKEKVLYFDEFDYESKVDVAVAIRSWAYLSLIRLYGEAVYIPDNVEVLPDNLSSFNILSREDMLDTLINQCRRRVYDKGAYNHAIDDEVYYINVMAIGGEVMLEAGLYDEAAMWLEASLYGPISRLPFFPYVINISNWSSIFVGAESYDKDEYYLVVPFSQEYQQENPLYNWTAPYEDYVVQPTSVLIDLYENNNDEVRSLGVTYNTIDDNNMYINKYLIDNSVPTSSDIIVCRAADIQLLLAEALNRANQHARSLLLVNGFGTNSVYKTMWRDAAGIRERLRLNDVNVPAGSDSLTVIEDLIIEERAMELAYEGKRWFDLMRVARRRGNDYLADRIAAKFSDASVAEEIRTKLMDESNWYLPYDK